MGLEAITFLTPLALGGLLLLPVIWWLLRFTPPRPQTLRFPPLRLLFGLVNREEQPDKTPWRLMLLRLAIAALVIIAVSHPLYAPGHVAAVNRVGHEVFNEGSDGIQFWGHSFVADPFGVVIAQASDDQEEVLIAEIDRARMEDVRRNWQFLRDRRIENYGDLQKRFID